MCFGVVWILLNQLLRLNFGGVGKHLMLINGCIAVLTAAMDQWETYSNSNTDRVRVNGGKLTISKVNLEDSGMYQCLAKNEHGVVYASAELKVVASPPDFSKSPLKKSTLVQRGGEVIIECRPHASPRASFFWRKGSELLKDSERYGSPLKPQ
ncbi:hypothetical protein NFI96_008502 [Prochilodus magdalenae]|nr:hypothetical protein NFI96_008502 [Prochilodus magdalenae]